MWVRPSLSGHHALKSNVLAPILIGRTSRKSLKVRRVNVTFSLVYQYDATSAAAQTPEKFRKHLTAV